MRVLGGQAMDSAPNTDRTERAEIILKVLAEGGSLTVLGIKTGNGWRFRLVRNESTLADLLNEEDRQGIEFRSESEWVDSWPDVQKLLDKYPWHPLHPVRCILISAERSGRPCKREPLAIDLRTIGAAGNSANGGATALDALRSLALSHHIIPSSVSEGRTSQTA
jgi:hypothetical protein